MVLKFFKAVSTQMEKSRYEEFEKIAQLQGTTIYQIVKNLVDDYLKKFDGVEIREDEPNPKEGISESRGSTRNNGPISNREDETSERDTGKYIEITL